MKYLPGDKVRIITMSEAAKSALQYDMEILKIHGGKLYTVKECVDATRYVLHRDDVSGDYLWPVVYIQPVWDEERFNDDIEVTGFENLIGEYR